MLVMADRFRVRPVEEDDIAAICGWSENAQELFWMFPAASWPLDEEQLRAAIEARSDSTVVLYDGRPAAFANFYKVKPGKFCAIGNVIVAPEYRGRGVATFLISEMERAAAEKYGAKEVSISCFNRNKEAISLYTKLGYSPYDIERRADGSGATALLIKMKKRVG